jgi:phage-related protein
VKANYQKEIEGVLGVKLPISYANFLAERSSVIVDGFKVLGVPTDKIIEDVGIATIFLRVKRPDLPKTLVAIIPVGDFVTCLDLSRATADDAPLVEVNLKDEEPPFELKQSFAEWLEFHQKVEKRFKRAMNRIANRQNELAVKKVVRNWRSVVQEIFGDVEAEALLIRQKRPEFPRTIIAIKVDGDQVLCLDLARATAKDVPVVKISMVDKSNPVDLGQNLSQLIATDLKKKNLFNAVVSRAEFLQKDEGVGKISDWSTPIFRVQDYIVALGAFRFSRRFNCLDFRVRSCILNLVLIQF